MQNQTFICFNSPLSISAYSHISVYLFSRYLPQGGILGLVVVDPSFSVFPFPPDIGPDNPEKYHFTVKFLR